MNSDEFRALRPGDRLRHFLADGEYIVLEARAGPGTVVVARVVTIDKTDGDQWNRVGRLRASRASRKKEKEE